MNELIDERVALRETVSRRRAVVFIRRRECDLESSSGRSGGPGRSVGPCFWGPVCRFARVRALSPRPRRPGRLVRRRLSPLTNRPGPAVPPAAAWCHVVALMSTPSSPASSASVCGSASRPRPHPPTCRDGRSHGRRRSPFSRPLTPELSGCARVSAGAVGTSVIPRVLVAVPPRRLAPAVRAVVSAFDRRLDRPWVKMLDAGRLRRRPGGERWFVRGNRRWDSPPSRCHGVRRREADGERSSYGARRRTVARGGDGRWRTHAGRRRRADRDPGTVGARRRSRQRHRAPRRQAGEHPPRCPRRRQARRLRHRQAVRRPH